MTTCLLLLALAQESKPLDREYVRKEGGTFTAEDREGAYFAEWLPPEIDRKEKGSVRLILSLHGTGGRAETEVKVWHPHAKKRNVGVVALQWQTGPDRFLPPHETYRRFDERIRELRKTHPAVAEHGHLLHGFSRGSANVPGLARLDNDANRRLCTLFVCNSGAWPPENPPDYVRVIDERKIEGAFRDQMFVGYFGGRDEEWGDTAIPNGRALRSLLEKQGAKIAKWWELPEGRHATMHRTPKMMDEVLDLWLK